MHVETPFVFQERAFELSKMTHLQILVKKGLDERITTNNDQESDSGK
jgi:hypothetical protein